MQPFHDALVSFTERREIMMKISVAMAIYNGRKYLEEQLVSIAKQSYHIDEIVIIDDASTETCDDIVVSFQKSHDIKIQYYKHEENIGYAQTFFEAIMKTSGDIIFLADQDDIWFINKVSTMVEILEKNSNMLCLASRNIIINEKRREIGKDKYDSNKFLEKIQVKQLIKQTGLRPGMTLALKSSLKGIMNNWDTSGFCQHDRFVEFCACIMNGYYILNQYLNYYRIHGNNTSGLNLSMKPRVGKQGRIEQIERELQYLYTLECSYKLNYSNDIRKIIESYIRYYSKRKQLLQSNLLSYFVGSFGLITYYYGIKIWLGDLYSLTLEWKFIRMKQSGIKHTGREK